MGLPGYALADGSNLSTAPVVGDYPPLRWLSWAHDAGEEAQPCPQRGRSLVEAQSRNTLPIRLDDSRHVSGDCTDDRSLSHAVLPEGEERSSTQPHVADGAASQQAVREAETRRASPTTKRPRVAGSDRDDRPDPSGHRLVATRSRRVSAPPRSVTTTRSRSETPKNAIAFGSRSLRSGSGTRKLTRC